MTEHDKENVPLNPAEVTEKLPRPGVHPGFEDDFPNFDIEDSHHGIDEYDVSATPGASPIGEASGVDNLMTVMRQSTTASSLSSDLMTNCNLFTDEDDIEDDSQNPDIEYGNEIDKIRYVPATPGASPSTTPDCLETYQHILTASREQSPEIPMVEDTLPELHIECEDNYKGEQVPDERVLCGFAHVIERARELERHTYNCSEGGSFVFHRKRKEGLVHYYIFKCSKKVCSKEFIIESDPHGNEINKLAALGAISVGSGFSQEEEKFAVLNSSYMSKDLFIKCERDAGEVLASTVLENLTVSINKEKELAIERNDVDNDGYACITVIVDGGWCKRSYGHGYNASSGVAVLIGEKTQKILFVGIKNKACLICSAIESKKIEPKDHPCWRNWTGPSTEMEPQLIVEGINYLEREFGIRCVRLIGDGDANTMRRIRERIPFGTRVRKIECANHLVRRYGRKLVKMSSDASKYKGEGAQARKLLKDRLYRLVIGARTAIKTHAAKNANEIHDRLTPLKEELKNGPAHVFGRHENCGDFCKRKENDPDGDVTNIISKANMLEDIKKEVDDILVENAKSLIWNATNNPAESYMNQFAKTIGGKRVDFSKAGGINRRAHAATLAFQTPGQFWHRGIHKKMTGRSPLNPLNNFTIRRRNRCEKRLQRRRLFPNREARHTKAHVPTGGDEFYGENNAGLSQPDKEGEELETLKRNFLLGIRVTRNDQFEETTRKQSESDVWHEERRKRISSTMIKSIESRMSATLTHKIVRQILYGTGQDAVSRSKAVLHGRAFENTARNEYIAKHAKNLLVQECGLFVHPEYPFLCASPDGLVGKVGLLEIKSPFSAVSYSSLKETVKAGCSIGLNIDKKDKNEKLYLPKSHKYYAQIQGQLAITGRQWCDLFVWSKNDSIVIKIFPDSEYWEKALPKLKTFYEDCLLPELVDPRANRNMELREPEWVLQAIRDKEEKKKSTNTEDRSEAPTSSGIQKKAAARKRKNKD